MTPTAYLHAGALVSADGLYRYHLMLPYSTELVPAGERA